MATDIIVLRAVRAALIQDPALKAPLPIATMTIPRQDKLPGISLALVPTVLERTLKAIQWKSYRLQVKTISLTSGADGADEIAEAIQNGVSNILGDPATAQANLNAQLAGKGWASTKVLECQEMPMTFDYLGADKDIRVWYFTQQFDLKIMPAA